MEVPGRSQAPPHGYSLVSDGDHYDFRGLRNEAKMRSMLKVKTERLVIYIYYDEVYVCNEKSSLLPGSLL